MENNFAALREATLGAQNIQSPTSNLGASNAPELAALYQSTFQLPQSSGAVAGAAGVAGDIEEEKRRAAAIARAAAAEAEKKKADLADPKKYRKLKKEDGGFDFYDPEGNQVDIATLVERTGTKPFDWIDDSENPIDIQYLNDYKNMRDYMDAIVSKDTDKITEFQQAEPGLGQYSDRGGLDRLMQEFRKSYQRYYIPRSADTNAWGAAPRGPLVPTPGLGLDQDLTLKG